MALDRLDPNFASLSKEYVLIQAWKKTSSYIRSHNSFADTLALDQATVNLPEFLERIRNRLKVREKWKKKPLRIVPAPKSQAWHVGKEGWRPEEAAIPLRPLSHVDLEEQVVATALMLCLADRVETKQGDPRTAVDTLEARRKVISYGNRLFCVIGGDPVSYIALIFRTIANFFPDQKSQSSHQLKKQKVRTYMSYIRTLRSSTIR